MEHPHHLLGDRARSPYNSKRAKVLPHRVTPRDPINPTMVIESLVFSFDNGVL
jgi:hypothetical protein